MLYASIFMYPGICNHQGHWLLAFNTLMKPSTSVANSYLHQKIPAGFTI